MTNNAIITVEENINANNSRNNVDINRPKSLLHMKKNYKKGDFVTTNDDKDVVEAYVVEKVEGDTVTLCGIKLTEEKDDVVPYSFGVHKTEVLYIGESFVNMYGALWNIRKQIMNTIG